MNYWGGTIDGKTVGIYAGYLPNNPSQGMVAVINDPTDPKGHFFAVPTATGPVKIVKAVNGVVTVQSIAGEFEVYNAQASQKVKTPGAAQYTFDIRMAKFR